MIYPEFFPEERKNEIAERQVFEELKKLSADYDIFYSRRFVSDGLGKKPEFEVDFIIAIPEKAIICLEVKGGIIQYDGASDKWTQNGRNMSKRPDVQATSAAHGLAKIYSGLIGGLPVGWALCFPDGQMENNASMPSSVSEPQVIDQLQLVYLGKAIENLFDFLRKQYPTRTGIRSWQYEKFKASLLRGLGFVQILGTKIKYDEKRFVELTEQQLNLFSRISANKDIITQGPAGSGKTIVAKTIAQDLLNDGKKVLFLCFNRTLANKIRYEFDRYETLIEVTTFHSLSRKIIEQFDSVWWNENVERKDDSFWDLDVPAKLEEYISSVEERYDALVIDEGQDFKEFWYELLFKLVKEDGRRLIFMDQMQNIFGHFTTVPDFHKFMQYTLPENCRNTKKIVGYLSELVGKEIKSFAPAPNGEEVVQKNFGNVNEQRKFILDEIKNLQTNHEIDAQQILILLNSPKAESCLSDITKFGKYDLKALDNKGRFQREAINYTTINIFKGLEADVVFVVDTQLIEDEQKSERLYTEVSRGRFKVYVLEWG